MIEYTEWKRLCKQAAREHLRLARQAWKARNKKFPTNKEHREVVPVGLGLRLWAGTEEGQSSPPCPECGSPTQYVESPQSPVAGVTYPAAEWCVACGYGRPKQGVPERWGLEQAADRLEYVDA